MMLRAIAIPGMIAALSGCITKPPRPNQVRTPPADRLLAYQNPTDGEATVIVTRDAGYSGSACYIAFFVDGKVAAKLASDERELSIYPPAITSSVPGIPAPGFAATAKEKIVERWPFRSSRENPGDSEY